MREQIAVLFGPSGGNAEKVARLIEKNIGSNNCVAIPVSQVNESVCEKFNKIIFGVSTVGTHTWTDDKHVSDWDVFLPKFRNIDFSGKKVAIYGLGDQIAYTNHFVDDMKIIYDIVVQQGGEIIGQWPTKGYDFNDSEAVVNNMFVGLAIDEDRQDELTVPRLNKWLELLKNLW